VVADKDAGMVFLCGGAESGRARRSSVDRPRRLLAACGHMTNRARESSSIPRHLELSRTIEFPATWAGNCHSAGIVDARQRR
jgi:hypothetical protein